MKSFWKKKMKIFLSQFNNVERWEQKTNPLTSWAVIDTSEAFKHRAESLMLSL